MESCNSLSELFSAGTPTTKMEASMYMHTSCPRAMSAQVDTIFSRKRFPCTERSQVSSVRNDIRIGKQQTHHTTYIICRKYGYSTVGTIFHCDWYDVSHRRGRHEYVSSFLIKVSSN